MEQSIIGILYIQNSPIILHMPLNALEKKTNNKPIPLTSPYLMDSILI